VNLVTIAEAKVYSSYSHEHLTWLVRTGKVKGRKSGNIWLIDLDDLKVYETRMAELGTKKFDPTRDDLP
jgi:hypothetical protein